MESSNPREFASYQRTKVRWQQSEGTWIVAVAVFDMAAGSGSPDRACVILHGTDELLVEQHTVPDGQTASPV
jgi:hypothetical protein